MSDPEFLPEWYRDRIRRTRGRRAAARATVALSLLAAAGIAVSPGRTSAVVVSDAVPNTAVQSPAPAARGVLPADAGRALSDLNALTPAGVEITALTFRTRAGVTALELRCAAADAAACDDFIRALRGSLKFRDVRVTPFSNDATSPSAAPSDGESALLLSLTVVPPEAP